MTAPITSQVTELPKKAYSPPKLEVFGLVSQLTQSKGTNRYDDSDQTAGPFTKD